MIGVKDKDIFELPKGLKEAMTVTTNGMIKKDGTAVMGRGIAKSVNDRYGVSLKLAEHIKKHGNTPCDLGIYNGYHILSFPTKNDWRDNSDIELIKQSAKHIVKIANDLCLERIYITKPGCANGHLDWENEVKPALIEIFDDRFVVCLDKNDILIDTVLDKELDEQEERE